MRHTIKIVRYHKFKEILNDFLEDNFNYIGSDKDFAFKKLYADLIENVLLKDRGDGDLNESKRL